MDGEAGGEGKGEGKRGEGSGSRGGKNGGQTKRGCVYTQSREEARVRFVGCFRTSVRFILPVESSRGSLDKRTKGQLFGGGKDSWSNRPQRERHDAMGRSGYFPPTAHRLKIESPPSYGKDYLNLRSALAMRMPPHLSSLLPHAASTMSIARTAQHDHKRFRRRLWEGRSAVYVRGVYKYRSRYLSRDVIVLVRARACVCTRSKGESNWTHLRTLKERCCDY